MSSLTLLPPNESIELKNTDIALRSVVPDYLDAIDFNPMTCDAKLLPYLAQCWQVLYWDEAWSEDEKRRFIRDAPLVHRHIGTPFAIKKMFEALDIEANITEWYESGGEPYTFDIELSLKSKEITPDVLLRLRKYVEVYKNVRTQLNDIVLSYTAKESLTAHMGCLPEVHAEATMVDRFQFDGTLHLKLHTGMVSETHAVAINKE